MIKILYSIYFDTIIKEINDILPSQIVHEIYDDDDMYIIFNIREYIKLPKNFIVFNFEQLKCSTFLYNFFDNVKNAKHIIDYSSENTEILKNALICRYSWSFLMKVVKVCKPFKERSIDVLFIGAITSRRYNLLNSLISNSDIKITICDNAWNDDYVNLLSEAKIVLNIHTYEGPTILEVHRILPCIINKVLVISEHSEDNYYDNIYKDMITWTDKENIYSTIKNLLNEDLDNLSVDRQKQLLKHQSLKQNLIEIFTHLQML